MQILFQLSQAGDIAHTFYEVVSPNASLIHSTDEKGLQQNRRYRSSPEPHPILPDTTCPFHMKPTWQDFPFADAMPFRFAVQFLHVLVLELFSIPKKLSLLVQLLSQKISRQTPELAQ